MPTSRLHPTGTSTPFQWGGTIGAAPYLATDDGDTSYVARQEADGAGDMQAVFDLEDLPAHAHRIISVRAGAKLRETAAIDEITIEGHIFLRLTGVNLAEAGTRNLPNYYVLAEAVFTGPPGGGAWTAPAVNATQLGLQASRPNTGNEVRCTYAYLDVEWAPQPGAFIY